MNNKDKMIRESAILMAMMGYSAFTMDLLIEKTGIAKSNAYYHFSTKELLGLSVLDYWCASLELLQKNTITNSEIPIQQRLSLYFEKLMRFQKVTSYCGDPVSNIAGEIRTTETQSLYQDRLNNFHRSFVRYINTGINNHIFHSNINIDSMAWLCVSLITSSMQDARIGQCCMTMIRVRDQIYSLLDREQGRVTYIV